MARTPSPDTRDACATQNQNRGLARRNLALSIQHSGFSIKRALLDEPENVSDRATKDDRSRAGSFAAKGRRVPADDPQGDALQFVCWRQKIASDSLPRRCRRLQREGD